MYYTKKIIPTVVLTLSLSLGFVGTVAASTYLQGTVTASGEPYTTSNSYVYISCNASNWTWASDWASISTSDGSYSMDTGNNSYSPCSSYYSGTTFTSCNVYAYPYWNDTTVARSDDYPITLNCNSAITQDVVLNVKDKTIAVTVTAGGNPVTSGITVYASQQESPWVYSYISDDVEDDGIYEIPVMAGNFYVSAYCSDWSNCNYGGYPSTTVAVADADTTKSASLSFSVKDKRINVSVTAGGTAIASDITVSCSQQQSPWTWASTSTYDSDRDAYSVLVNAGSYNCNAYCSNWSGCAYSGYPSTSVTVGAGDSDVSASLAFTVKDKTMRVTIADTSGATITSGMTAYASEQGGGWSWESTNTSNGDGTYHLGVGTAKYYVSAYCTNYDSCNVAGYPNATVDIEESDTTVDVTLTFLKNDATISGAVTDGTSGISNVGVSVYSYSVGGSADTGVAWSIGKTVSKATITGGSASTTTVSNWVQTDSIGAFQLTIPAGTYTVSVWPPWDRQDLGSASIQVTATSNATTAVNITLPSKTAQISGTVKDATGTGIANVSISGWSYNGLMGSSDWFWDQTDSSGAFTVYAIEGLKYNVSSWFWSSDSSNTICNYTNEGMQTVVASSDPQTVNFTYPTCDCTITLNAVDSNGSLLSSIYGGVNAAPSTLASGEYWYGIWGNISGGTGTMKVQSDVEYTFSPYVWDANYVQGSNMTGTCTDGSSSIDLEMLALDATISGSYVDGAGAAIALEQYSYMYVYTTKGSAYRSCTASSSGYSCQVSAGEWCMGYWIDQASGYASASAGSSTLCVTMTSGGSQTSDITLLQTGTISVSVVNVDGSGKFNVWVEATPYSNEDHGANDYQRMYMSNGCMTDTSGACTINVGAASGDGTVYYLNAYIPYYLKESDNLMNPQEVSVTVVAGVTVIADPLTFQQPDGTSVVTVVEGSTTASIVLGKSISKDVTNADEAASSPIANATVDCFSTSGGSFEVETDESGVATCPCTTTDTWKAVAHNMVANNLWMSESTDITCLAGGGVGSVTVNNVATVPEGKSVTISDAGAQTLTIELSDGFSVFFPIGSLGDSGEQVTCNVEPTVTPFTSNRRPASFYGYTVSCQDGNGAAIIQLNSNATFTIPVNQTQVENVGMTMEDIEPCYFDDSTGAYNTITTATIDATNDVVTYQQNHLTDFVVVGNGNLVGVTGEEAGEEANEHAEEAGEGASAATGGCGCSMNANPPLAEKLIIPLFIVFLFGIIRIAKFVLVKVRKK